MPVTPSTAAKPTKSIFDPFNSSATGHQRAENRLGASTSWRDSRNLKLNGQFSAGAAGGPRVSDTVGAGSLDFGRDGRTQNGGWARGAPGLRPAGQLSIVGSLVVDKYGERPAKRARVDEACCAEPTAVVNPFAPFRRPDGSVRESSWTSHEVRQECVIAPSRLLSPLEHSLSNARTPPDGPGVEGENVEAAESNVDEEAGATESVPPQIFGGLTIYVNGSTAPVISDHRLKHLLKRHGARTSVALGRRSVTHVVVGRPNGSGGSGGGLAGSKIHKEITRVGGKGVKFVTADWIVESVRAGRRLSERDYQGLRLSAKGVRSVASLFGAVEK